MYLQKEKGKKNLEYLEMTKKFLHEDRAIQSSGEKY